jgi:hypothetical protein
MDDATAGFHLAVLGAHTAGCSERLIAERVGLSQQRVHQIIAAARG